MKMLKYSNLKPTILAIVVKVLKAGGVVIYPTETVYGIGCDPFNIEAIKMIYQIKGRDFVKPLPLIADSIKTVEKYFLINKTEKVLLEKYWPGALTILLPTKSKYKKLLKTLNSQNGKIAVRVSSLKIAQTLAGSLGGLVVSTSANLSGQKECLSKTAVIRQLRGQKILPDLILDGGKLKKIILSTIVEVVGNEIKILRQGAVSIKVKV